MNEVTRQVLISVLTAAGFFWLALASLLRGKQHPMAQPFGQLTLMLAFYKLFEPASEVANDRSWDVLEYVAASLACPPALALFAAYLGLDRRLKWLLRFVGLYFVAVAGLLAASHFMPEAVVLTPKRWAVLVLIGLVPPFLPLLVIAAQNVRAGSPKSRARTQMIATALLLGVGGVSTDLMNMAGYPIPRLADFGLVVSVVPLGLVAMESDLIRRVGGPTNVTVALLALAGAVGQMLVFAWAGGEASLLLVGTLSTSLLLVATIRPLLLSHDEERHRLQHLTTLGRLSSQMAHDLRNPLAALKGALDLLQEERRRGVPLDGSMAYLDLAAKQVERMQGVVEDYKRLGKVEPALREQSPGLIAQSVVEAFRLAAPPGIQIRLDVESDLPTLRVDGELIAAALDNLLRNAIEAMGDAGSLSVSVGQTRSWTSRRIRFDVKDDGPGMEPHVAEQAFDEAYTTKATGTGLGLSFVSRVAEAHEGRVRLDSKPGRGTRVEFSIPVRT